MLNLWTIMALTFALVLGLSVVILAKGRVASRGVGPTLATLATGLVVGTVGAVLALLALWPPFHPITTILPLAFMALLLGLLYFVRATAQGGKALRSGEDSDQEDGEYTKLVS